MLSWKIMSWLFEKNIFLILFYFLILNLSLALIFIIEKFWREKCFLSTSLIQIYQTFAGFCIFQQIIIYHNNDFLNHNHSISPNVLLGKLGKAVVLYQMVFQMATKYLQRLLLLLFWKILLKASSFGENKRVLILELNNDPPKLVFGEFIIILFLFQKRASLSFLNTIFPLTKYKSLIFSLASWSY